MEIITRSYKYCSFYPVVPDYTLVTGMLYSQTVSPTNRNLRVMEGILNSSPFTKIYPVGSGILEAEKLSTFFKEKFGPRGNI